MDECVKRWSSQLASWANAKPEISELWMFGSRARGDHRQDSDLDVAVIVAGESPGTRLGNWVALANIWEKELQQLLPVSVDLDVGNDDISEKVVAPALKREGIRIFCRSKKS